MIAAAIERLRSVRAIGAVIEWLLSLLPWRTPTASLDPDVAFRIVSSARRRHLVRALEETDAEAIDVSELAALVAATEYGLETDALDADQRKRVYVSLYQTHLPRMADLGLIEYDVDAGIVRPTAESAAIAAAVDDVDGQIQREVIL